MPPDPDPVSDSTQALLDAVAAISSDLDLRSVLSRIVEAATRLTGARYGALGVIGSHDALVEFVTTGLGDDERAAIGDLPHGRGILGLLIRHPEPIRLDDLTQHPDATGFPPHHPPMQSFLGVPVRIRGTVFGNLYLTEKAGTQSFTAEDQQMVEALANAAGYVIDNARAYGLSERRRQWLEAAADLDDALQPPVEPARALREVARAARTVARARVVAVSVRGQATPYGLAVADPAETDAATAVVDAVLADPAIVPAIDPIETTVGAYDVFVAPLRTHLVGGGTMVGLFAPGTRPLPVEDRELFVSFAEHAALSLDRAQGVDDRAELAVTSDRERIARDLHDLVIQRLFATGLQLQRAEAGAVGPDVAEIVRRAVDSLDQTIRDIRGTIFELQQHGSGPSLRADVRALVREYAPLLKFDPVVRTSGPVDTAVPREVRDQLLSVLREALSNLARHAAADHGEVDVSVDDDELWLTVIDDGVGLSPGRAESGLRNARRRATALGGVLEVGPRTPRGTSFVWRVPLP
ncbi:GAF domain-containing sensor histidine kinase [Nocardioides mangrovi]|uniref:GAF domain-containing protein n=1 Tax=Nocardioides mangrovi TaxID=2874580 RepID=A0ABS7UGI8_9ACTN|nr:GAF domain-containing sensor histidine kinase [Nocardioides mangrovi]MBZ5739791.1 GAF domain-containing protein [Nocardioides mangrovi]